MLYNPSTIDFFKHPERTGETPAGNVRDCFGQVFMDVYQRLKNSSEEHMKKISVFNSLDDHPLYQKLVEHLNNPKPLDENSKCEEVFSYYIFKVSRHVKQEFFARILKFIILFRECLNVNYKDRVKGTENISTDYSELMTAEDVPDISNEFVTEYLCTDACQFDFQRDEAIDFTQNFCQWLYDNNYTCSKLSLINNY